MTGPDSEGLQAEAVARSASAFGSGQCSVADVLTRPDTGLRSSSFDQRFLVVGEAHGNDVGARVVAGRSAGARAHAETIAYTERLAPLDFYVYDKSMTNSEVTMHRPAMAGELDWRDEDGAPECGWLAEPGTERFGCVWTAGHFGAHATYPAGWSS